MAPKKPVKKSDVKSSQVGDVSRGSNEHFKRGLSSEEGKNTVINQPEMTSAPIGESNEIVKREEESQKTHKEPLNDRDEQVETTKKPSQQQNETQQRQKERQKNDQEQIQETKESSFSPLQSTEDTNQVARRRGVGKAADVEGMKRKNETPQMDEEPVENIDVEQETSKDSTLVHQSTEEINSSDQRREAGNQENVQNEPISPPSTWMMHDDEGMKRKNKTPQMDEEPVENICDVKQETSKNSTLVYQSTEEINSSDQRREAGKQENVQNEPISPPSTWMMHHLVVVLLLIFMVILLFPPEPAKKADPDLATSLNDKIVELKSLFSNQTENFWKTFRIHSLVHLKSAHPKLPLVLAVGVPPSARDVAACMVKKLAKVLDPNHKRDFITIDGLEEMNNPWKKVNKKIYDLLNENFEAGHKVALINHLELFPPPSHMMFHSFCDDQNAPYKRVEIIFTVYLPKEADFPLSSNKEVEDAVDKYLVHEVWGKEELAATQALSVRVTQIVIFMNGESSDSIKTSCP